jgi:ankyrin repeat protein
VDRTGALTGMTPICYAIVNGEIECITILIDNNVDLNVQDRDGWSPLHYASGEGNMEIIKLLLDTRKGSKAYGADKTIVNRWGQTAAGWIADRKIKKYINDYEGIPLIKEPEYA